MANYREEFPDFKLHVRLPDLMTVDMSWHNDTCPSWSDEKGSLRLFVDYEDENLRECPSWPRYHLHELKDFQEIDGKTIQTFETDSWKEMLTFLYEHVGLEYLSEDDHADYIRAKADAVQLAKLFCKHIHAYIGREKVAEAVKLNLLQDDKIICHTHDFCDANMAMLAAWEEAGIGNPGADDEVAAQLWGQVWHMAMAAQFNEEYVVLRKEK